jgi:DNA-directed RNA polymerase delta subunit
MNSTPITKQEVIGTSGTKGSSGTPPPAERIELLQSKINLIARKFDLSDQSSEDIIHTMIERLLTRCAVDPSFIGRDDGYWLCYANWMGYHELQKTIIYQRFTINETRAVTDNNPYDLYEDAADPGIHTDPEIECELTDLRE